tara:strand:- start:89361 stop:89999 length:639 start_codon:yes stop_codon:yes gene_type:complete
MVKIYKYNKKLEKLETFGNCQYELNTGSRTWMHCGTYYHDGKCHALVGAHSNHLDLLEFLIKSLKGNVERKNNMLIFSGINTRHQRLLFKICRYIRNKSHIDILNKMKDIIKKGVKPYNALLISHLIVHATDSNEIRGHSENMDPMRFTSITHRYAFRSWDSYMEELKSRRRAISNINIFSPKNLISIEDLKSNLNNPMKIQRIIYEPFKKK